MTSDPYVDPLTPVQLAELAHVLWPDLVETGGRVYRAGRAPATAGGNGPINYEALPDEAAANALAVVDLTQADPGDQDLLSAASLIAQLWQARLGERFPGRDFDVEMIPGDRGPVVSFRGRTARAAPLPSPSVTMPSLPTVSMTTPVTPGQLLKTAELWWPRLIEIDGCLLIEERYEQENFQRWRTSYPGDCAVVESVLNKTHL